MSTACVCATLTDFHPSPTPVAATCESRQGAADDRLPCDTVMIDRLLAGNEHAFSLLVDRYANPMLRLAQAFVSSRSVAEEVVQETWVALLRGLGRFQRRSSLKTWLFRILTNRAKTRGVRERRTIPFTALSAADDGRDPAEPANFAAGGSWMATPDAWDSDTPERLALLAEARSVVEEAVDSLPAKQRAVMTLRDLEHWSARDACNVLDISETYQRVLLHRARTKVRRVLVDYQHGRNTERDAHMPRADGTRN